MRNVYGHGHGWALTRGSNLDPNHNGLRLHIGLHLDDDGVPAGRHSRAVTIGAARDLHAALGRAIVDHDLRALHTALGTRPADDAPDLSQVLADRITEESTR